MNFPKTALALPTPLLGAGLGAAAGAAGGALAADPGQRASGAIKGGLLGGAAGGAAGALAGRAMPKLAPAVRPAVNKTIPGAPLTMAPPSSGVRPAAAGPVRPAANPTLDTANRFGELYGSLSPSMRTAVENSEAVKKWGLTPQAASQLAWMSRRQGEGFSDAIARHILPGNIGGKVPSFAGNDLVTKVSFAVSQYSGVLGPQPPPYPSYIPPFRVPPFKKAKDEGEQKVAWAAMVDEFVKLNGLPKSPAARLSSAQAVGGPRVTNPTGPSIADVSKPIGFGRPQPGATKEAMDKAALIERLIRLGATDIPNTPRLVMKHRNPQELKALQNNVEGWWNKKVTDPLMQKAEGLYLNKMKPGKVKDAVTQVTRWAAEDPIGTLAVKPTPVPYPLYIAGKKALEKGIDKAFPLPP